jgi:hypothetical protein
LNCSVLIQECTKYLLLPHIVHARAILGTIIFPVVLQHFCLCGYRSILKVFTLSQTTTFLLLNCISDILHVLLKILKTPFYFFFQIGVFACEITTKGDFPADHPSKQ